MTPPDEALFDPHKVVIVSNGRYVDICVIGQSLFTHLCTIGVQVPAPYSPWVAFFDWVVTKTLMYDVDNYG